jgi:hypothetical protein
MPKIDHDDLTFSIQHYSAFSIQHIQHSAFSIDSEAALFSSL